jgi:hypothetical protein
LIGDRLPILSHVGRINLVYSCGHDDDVLENRRERIGLLRREVVDWGNKGNCRDN